PAPVRHHASRGGGGVPRLAARVGRGRARERGGGASQTRARQARGHGRPARRGRRPWRSSVARDKVAVLWTSSGRGSAWLERVVRDHEVGGSNPLAPTKLLIQISVRGSRS